MKKLLSVLVLVAMVLSLAACSGGDEWESMLRAAEKMGDAVEDAQVRAYTEQMLQCILADDFDGAYALVQDTVEKDAFVQAYADICAVLSGVQTYTLTASYKSANVNNGVSSVAIRYMLDGGQKRIMVESACTENTEGLAGFYVYEYIPVTQTGTLNTMKGANAGQWILLIVGVLEMAFVLWMFVDCCCHKMKRKWLWLLLILLGAAAVTWSMQNGVFRMNFNVGLFFNLYTALIVHSDGGFALRIMVPVGAVVYAVMRKNLFRQYEMSKRAQSAPVIEQPSDEEAPTAKQEIPGTEDQTAEGDL